MIVDNFDNHHHTPRKTKAFKPGIVSLKGRNFDFSDTRPGFFRRLVSRDYSIVQTKNNRPNNYTLFQGQNRDRFYHDQRNSFIPASNYTETADALRLGGL